MIIGNYFRISISILSLNVDIIRGSCENFWSLAGPRSLEFSHLQKTINFARSKTVKLPVSEGNSRAVASFKLP
jgi:hypothetical protein